MADELNQIRGILSSNRRQLLKEANVVATGIGDPVLQPGPFEGYNDHHQPHRKCLQRPGSFTMRAAALLIGLIIPLLALGDDLGMSPSIQTRGPFF